MRLAINNSKEIQFGAFDLLLVVVIMIFTNPHIKIVKSPHRLLFYAGNWKISNEF